MGEREKEDGRIRKRKGPEDLKDICLTDPMSPVRPTSVVS